MNHFYCTLGAKKAGGLRMLALCLISLLPMSTALALEHDLKQRDNINLGYDFSFTSASPLFHTGDYVHHGMTTTSWAASGIGGNTFLRAKQAGKNSSTHIRTSIRFDDLVFTGPASSVTVTPNFFVAGSVNIPSSYGGYGAVMKLQVSMYYSTPLNVGIYRYPSTYYVPPYGAIGEITAPSFSGVFVGRTFTVPVGVAVSMTVTMEASVISGAQNGVGVDSFIDFGSDPVSKASVNGSGVGFPLGSPVFDLPEGFTVNSAEAKIVDNMWSPDPVSVRDGSWGEIKSLFR